MPIGHSRSDFCKDLSYARFHPTGLLNPSHSCRLRASSDLASHLPSSYLPTALCVSGTREYASVGGPRRRACRVTEIRGAIGNARGRWLGTGTSTHQCNGRRRNEQLYFRQVVLWKVVESSDKSCGWGGLLYKRVLTLKDQPNPKHFLGLIVIQMTRRVPGRAHVFFLGANPLGWRDSRIALFTTIFFSLASFCRQIHSLQALCG